MANIIQSAEEHPENLFDHLLSTEITVKTRLAEEPRCLAIHPFTDQIYVLMVNDDYRYWDVLIYSQSGEFLEWFSHASIESIHGMAIHKNDVYLLSRLSCFHHFILEDYISLVNIKNDKGTGSGEFMEARQLDISNEGNLFVADFGNNRVQILDRKLQYKRHISHHSMVKPSHVKLSLDEVYVLGDSPEQSTHCIHTFTHMGEKLRSVILNGIPNCMRCRGFCIDTGGNVIITDDATSQIKFFTKEGNLFQTMDTFGKIAGSSEVLIGVAWMTNHKLIVLSTHICNRLEIYYSSECIWTV